MPQRDEHEFMVAGVELATGQTPDGIAITLTEFALTSALIWQSGFARKSPPRWIRCEDRRDHPGHRRRVATQ